MKKTLLSLAALTSISLALTSCGGGTPTPPPVVDTTAPGVVSVTPSSGATGVSKDANVVVTFSEPMNQASAQAAFQSASLGTNTITWNANGTVMTVNPNADLEYTSSGKTYTFSVTTTATDKAGNALSSASEGSFKTFKRIITNVLNKASTNAEINNTNTVSGATADIQVGDAANNSSKRGFVGFDLSTLPADLVPANIESARVKMYVEAIVGQPFTQLFPPSNCSGGFCFLLGKSVVLEHVSYGNTVAASAYDITPLSSEVRGLSDDTPCGGLLLCLFSGTVQGWNSDNVTAWVKDDVQNRVARGNNSQYRLKFPIATNGDNSVDRIEVKTDASKPFIQVTYLIP